MVDSFLAAVADKSNQPVFIHCGSANRVGGVWMIKRALQDKWPIEKALTEARGDRPEQPAAEDVRHRLHREAPVRLSRLPNFQTPDLEAPMRTVVGVVRRWGFASWTSTWIHPTSAATATRSSSGSRTTSTGSERYPVLPRVAPGDVVGALPDVTRRSRASRSRPSSPTSSASSFPR